MVSIGRPSTQEVSFIFICLPIFPPFPEGLNRDELPLEHELPEVINSEEEGNEYEVFLLIKKDVTLAVKIHALLIVFKAVYNIDWFCLFH